MLPILVDIGWDNAETLCAVSGVATEDDFFARCAAGEIVPVAIGAVKQRPIINGTSGGRGRRPATVA